MADNAVLNAGTGGVTAAADDIGGVHHQRVKLSVGADGTASDAIPVSNGLDTTAAGVQAVGLVGQLDDVATGAVTENQFAPVRISTRRAILVEGVASGTAVPVSGTFWQATQPVSGTFWQATQPVSGTVTVNALPAGANNIGDVDVLTVNGVAPAFGTGVRGATVQRVTIATDDVVPASQSGTWTVQPGNTANTTAWKVDGSAVTQPVSMATNTPVGTVAHDAADSGAPLKVGFRADTTFQAAVADADRVDGLADVYGVQFTRIDHPNKWSYHENSSSALTDTTVQAAPGASLSLYVTDIVLSCGGATAMSLIIEESTTTTVLGPYYLEAVAGRTFHIRFGTPKKITANTLISVTTTGAVAHGLDILGFIAP